MKQIDELQCGVVRLSYDFGAQIGELHMDDGDCCDMEGCIGLFARIDPDVIEIKTYSGPAPDTMYSRRTGSWVAIPHTWPPF
jgi:hypothetical protein